ncbi:hypothetical protein TIFTF001_036492 [Ficus carica]|uniref:Leucine-rich repeat-containing N-terminal plant-type domain-containing protein n=1 Tax=Ficus carica TaxID=3494 RepID=A0AA88JB98_FICCA|nr:hypothetical protein TIFTF001_036492 [Ficus carica]
MAFSEYDTQRCPSKLELITGHSSFKQVYVSNLPAIDDARWRGEAWRTVNRGKFITKKVLREIKKSFNDPDIFVSWDLKTDCCNWTFIICDNNNCVGELVVADVDCDLVGPISSEVGDLTYLLWLGFADCANITGTIPPTIAKLNNLEALSIRNKSYLMLRLIY